MTVDEELAKLEDNLRRLKIEYDAFFNGGLPRPPHDLLFRVEATIKKFSAGSADMNFAQRFRFNQLAQRFAVYNDLWRKKVRAREEGLIMGGSRPRMVEKPPPEIFGISWSDPDREQEKVNQLFSAMVEARRSVGDAEWGVEPETFASFLREKTRQIKQELDCEEIRFSVTVEEGRVRFRAGKAS
ncbi:MAG: MXAN_5187 C-terminal domain-containing protein [Terriglobia bacterium]